MQGNLKQIQLPEVLQFISMGKSTGLLTVKDGAGVETTLMIRSGRIINSSALERQRRLGDLLVHRGILRRSVLSQVLALQRTVESDKKLGQILVERDIIQQSQIREVLRLQLEEEIWNLFGIEEGEFRFEQVPDEKLGEATVQIDIEPLLLEGTRRQDEWRRVIRILPSDRLVPMLKIKKNEERPTFKLDAQEWRVLAQVNGHMPIRAVINRAGMGRFEVYQILASFLQRGVIQIRDESKKEAKAADEVVQQVAAAPVTANKGGLGSLFSIFSSARVDEKGERLQFITPVGSLAWLCNRMTESFMASKELKAVPQDSVILETLWSDLINSFVRADLIRVSRNNVSCTQLEGFMKVFEFSEATQDCYEDSIEALLQLANGIYRYFAQRIGERSANRIAKEAVEEAQARAVHQYATDFKLTERVQMVLRLQA